MTISPMAYAARSSDSGSVTSAVMIIARKFVKKITRQPCSAKPPPQSVCHNVTLCRHFSALMPVSIGATNNFIQVCFYMMTCQFVTTSPSAMILTVR